jgi:glutathione synthase/RimK-type ligase-like ATP-grasp enzyme
MKKLYYLPYQMHSGSVNEIQAVLGGLKVRPNGNYSFLGNHLVVNWGSGHCPYWGNVVGVSPRLLNHWNYVAKAINKLSAFQIFKEKDVPTPEWTASRAIAEQWLAAGRTVFCRTKLSSMEGRGIVVATNASELVDAPLYTRLFPKDKEYRVHVFKGEVLDYVQKKLKHGAKEIPGRNKFVRNTANGWVFAREGVTISDQVREISGKAVEALGLDFGAVDLAVSKEGKVVVFEVNTAPGIEGTTITKYAEAIKKYQTSLN